jgi:hypothetical protein
METKSVIEARSSVTTAAWSAIDADLLRRVRRTSIVLGITIGIPLAFYFGLAAGAGWLSGIAWSLVNLFMIESVVRHVLAETRDRRVIVLAMLVKFPVLYGAGLFLLAVLRLPAAWLVAGFTWPLFVAVMKAAGRAYLGLDESPARREGPGS